MPRSPAVAPVLLTAAYVSLAAILTRSTVAALVIGLVITTVEQLFRGFAPLLEPLCAGLVGALYQALPGYHLANIGTGSPKAGCWKSPSPRAPSRCRRGARSASSAAWIAVLIGLTFRALPPPGHQLGQQAPDRAEIVARCRRRGR